MSDTPSPRAAELFAALQNGDADVVRALVAAEPPLGHARGEMGATPLLLAVYLGKRELAEVLLDAGVVPDLWEAAALGDEARVRTLLAEEPARLREYSPDGWTPLHLSVFFGHAAVAELLLQAGADLTAVSRNGLRVNPLQSALAGREVTAALLLLEHGADPNPGGDGWPPLHYAAHYNLVEVARELLRRGADPGARAADGKSALDMAEAEGSSEVAGLLRAVA